MPTQTGSIDFKSTKGFQSYASGQYATLAQVKGQFATCSTAAATQAKAATIVPTDTGWELYTGATITVRFTADNTHATPTLNVNSTGAKSIRDHTGAALTEDAYKWKAGDALAFTYDGTYWRMQDTLAQRVTTNKTAIEQNARDITFRATKTEAAQMAQPNLSPFFESTPYRTTASYDGGYWQKTADNWLMAGVTHLSDGWAHIERAASTKLEVAIPVIESVDPSKTYTLMFEWRNVSVTSGANLYARNYPNNCQFTKNTYNCSWNASSPSDGVKYVQMEVDTTAKAQAWQAAINLGMNVGSSASFTGDVRISLYEGEYTGPYKPYVGSQLYASKAELKVANDAISLRATKEEVEKTYSTKEDSQLDRAGSGTSVTIEGAANAALKGLHVLGESVQDGTPAPDAPVPIVSVGGVNLLADSDTGSGWAYSTFDASTCEYTRSTTATGESYVTAKPMTFEAGQTYTLSCWAKSNGYVKSLDVFKVHSSGGGSHQSRTNISLTTEYQRIVWTFTCNAATAETAYIRFDNNGSTTSGTAAILYIKEPQLEVGPNCNPYVPTGSLGIWLRGKNLLSFLSVASFTRNGITYSANASTQTISVSGTATANNTDMDLTLAYPIHVPEGSTVTLSLDGTVSSEQFVVFLYDGSYFEYHNLANSLATFTEAGGRTIRLVKLRSGTASGAQNINARIQLELGSEATEYEPYSGTVTPVPLNGHELRSLPDGTRDELTIDVDGHVTMTQRVGSVENVGGKISAASTVYTVNGLKCVPYTPDNYSASSRPSALAAMITTGTVKSSSQVTTGDIYMNPANIMFMGDANDTAADIKTLYANATLTYPLATPQTIDLGTIDMPQVQDGDTVEVIAALTPSIDVTWWASAGQAVADAYASLSSAIEVRAESIVSTVSERYATSDAVDAIATQITQTATSWTAAFNQLRYGDDEEPTDDNKKLKMTLAQAFEALGVTSENLDELRSYVRIATDAQNKPYLLMGSEKSPIMMALTNDSLKFMHGSDPVAYIDVDGETNEGELHITRATIDNELRFGNKELGSIWRWHVRANGNLALGWTSGAGDE